MKIKKFVKLIILECLIIFLFCNYNTKKKKKLGHVLIITSIIICNQTERYQKTPFGRNRYTLNRGRNRVKRASRKEMSLKVYFTCFFPTITEKSLHTALYVEFFPLIFCVFLNNL